jgi:hypothetical protein
MSGPPIGPYAPPQTTYAASQAPTGAPLYTPNQIALATFLGSPLAGTVLFAMNERRLGRDSAVLPVVLLGALGTALLFGVSAVLPESMPTMPLGIASVFGIRAIAQARQHAVIAEHLAAGRRKGSGWIALGVGLAGMVVCLAVILAAVSVVESAEPW